MDKYKAIYLMQNGLKITHQLFESGEYIFMIDDCIYDENEYKITDLGPNMDINFWTDRKGQEWEEGWSIYKTDAELLMEMERNPHMYKDVEFGMLPIYETPYFPRVNKYDKITKNSHKRTNKRKR